MIQKRITINYKSLLIGFLVFTVLTILEMIFTERALPEALELPIIILGLIMGSSLLKRLTFPKKLSKYLHPIWNTLFISYLLLLFAFTNWVAGDPLIKFAWANLGIFAVVLVGLAILIWIFTLLDEKQFRKKTAFTNTNPIILSSKARFHYLAADQHPDPGRLILQEDALWFVRKYGEPIKMEFEEILSINIEYRYIFFMPVLLVKIKEGVVLSITTTFPFHWKKVISSLP